MLVCCNILVIPFKFGGDAAFYTQTVLPKMPSLFKLLRSTSSLLAYKEWKFFNSKGSLYLHSQLKLVQLYKEHSDQI